MQVAAFETVTVKHWPEERFLELWLDHRQSRFRFDLLDGTFVEGYVIKAVCTIGDPPQDNMLFICKSLNCAHPLRDQVCREITFAKIRDGRRLDN